MTATRPINMTPFWVFFVSILAMFLFVSISSYGHYRVHAHTANHSEAENVIRTCMPTDATERMTFGDHTNPSMMAVVCFIEDDNTWAIVIIVGSLIINAYFLGRVKNKRQAIRRVEENKEYHWRLDKEPE